MIKPSRERRGVRNWPLLSGDIENEDLEQAQTHMGLMLKAEGLLGAPR